jgi:hypothetical protein
VAGAGNRIPSFHGHRGLSGDRTSQTLANRLEAEDYHLSSHSLAAVTVYFSGNGAVASSQTFSIVAKLLRCPGCTKKPRFLTLGVINTPWHTSTNKQSNTSEH